MSGSPGQDRRPIRLPNDWREGDSETGRGRDCKGPRGGPGGGGAPPSHYPHVCPGINGNALKSSPWVGDKTCLSVAVRCAEGAGACEQQHQQPGEEEEEVNRMVLWRRVVKRIRLPLNTLSSHGVHLLLRVSGRPSLAPTPSSPTSSSSYS